MTSKSPLGTRFCAEALHPGKQMKKEMRRVLGKR
jgi:hypothetical protein